MTTATTRRIDTKCPLSPNGKKVIVRRLEKSDKVGGIYIPDVAQESAQLGIVCATGQKVENPDIREGVLVAFGKYAGAEFRLDGVWLLMGEDEILGVVTSGDIADRLLIEGA